MSFSEKTLDELAKNVFSDKYEFINGPVQFKGQSGKYWKFDAVVKDKLNTFGVFIRDWKREISITQLRQLHKACKDLDLSGGVMVCNIITDFSRDYSSQFGIQLLSRGHLISTLRRRQFKNNF
ncbi:MAG: hypothetical protein ACXACO_19625 [Promethearchaeota archaeon]|jgi:hypothetical protein